MNSVAINFVNFSIMTQTIYANQLLNNMCLTKVYIYDKVYYFSDATIESYDNIRYLVKDNNYAVLSTAAQHAFSVSDYKRYASSVVLEDTIGIYISLE